MSTSDLYAEARRTPLTRAAITELARRIDLDEAADRAHASIDAAGAYVAEVLAFTLALGGRKLAPSFVRALLPELENHDHAGPLVFAADGDPVALILDFLGDRTALLEREALCLLLAADALGDQKPPPGLLVHARYLARHELEAEAKVWLGAAAARLADRDLSELAAAFIASAKRSRRAVDQVLEAGKRSPLEALPEVAAPRVTVGYYTVRRAKEVGRNDPCPCGSGQKYKKCCAGKQDVGGEADALDAAALTPDQARFLRPSEIARLDVTRVPTASLAPVLRRAVALRRWGLVDKILGAADQRPELASEREELRIVALAAAFDADARDAAERLIAGLPEGKVDASLELAMLRRDPELPQVMERVAERALREEGDGAAMIDLAYNVLKRFPALGILVARGAVHEGRPRESAMLIEQIEDARDRLLLPPFEPWWDVYDALAEGPGEAKPREDGRATELRGELRRARAQSRKASTEIAQLKSRLEELDAQVAAAPVKAPSRREREKVEPVRAPIEPGLEEERRRLRGKVDELQRIIGEGQEERRELRRRLEEMEEEGEDGEDAAGDAAAKAAASAASEQAREDAAYGRATVDEPRRVLVPAFTERATRALADLSGPAADVVLSVVAGLASSRENAWGGVKRLEKAKSVHSARAGIHYRVLFTIDDGALRVHEVVHRRDLEPAVSRMVRLG